MSPRRAHLIAVVLCLLLIPSANSLSAACDHIVWHDRLIPANPFGNPSGIFASMDKWEEFLVLADEAEKTEDELRVWNIIYCLSGSTAMLRLDSGGMLHPERAAMTAQQREFCTDAFQLFMDMVTAYTGGVIKVESTAHILDKPWRWTYRETAFFYPHDYPDLGEGFNTGDYDSVIGHFYPGPVRTPFASWTGKATGWCSNLGESSIAYDPSRETTGQIPTLTSDTLREWLEQVETAQQDLGLCGMPGMDSLSSCAPNPSRYFARWIVPPGEWRALSTRGEPVRVQNRPVSPREGFIQEWLLCGPFFAQERYALGRDFFSTADLAPTDGDLSAEKEWRLLMSNGPEIDLRSHFPVRRKDAVIFAHAYIFSESDIEARLWMGCSSPFAVAVNGEVGMRAWSASGRDTVMRKVNLKAGWNRLLVKIIDRGSENWWFSARVTGDDSLPSSETVFSAVRPEEEFAEGEGTVFPDVEIERFSWEDVKDDPWGTLPVLDEEHLDKLLRTGGARILADASDASLLIELPESVKLLSSYLPELSTGDHALNNQLSFARETMAFIRWNDSENKSHDLLLLRPDVLEPFLDLSRKTADADPARNVLGYILRDGLLAVVVETSLPEMPPNEFAMLTPNDGMLTIDTSFSTPRVIRGENASVDFHIRNIGENIIDVGTLELTGLPGGRTVEVGKIYNFVPTEEKTFTWKLGSSGLPPGLNMLLVQLSYEVGSSEFAIGKPLPVEVNDPVQIEISRNGSCLVTRHEFQITLRVTNRSGIRERGKVELGLPPDWKAKPSSMSFDLRKLGQSASEDVRIRISDDVPGGDAVIIAQTELRDRKDVEPIARLPLMVSFSKYLVRNRFDGAIDGGFTMSEGLYRVSLSRDDPALGASCLSVDDGGGSKYGHVWMFDQALFRTPESAQSHDYSYRTHDYPLLDFNLKSDADDQDLAILVTLDTGETCGILLSGEWDKSLARENMIGRADFAADGKWHRIVVDLDELLDEYLGTLPHVVREIKFGDVRHLDHGWWPGTGNTKFYIDEFSIRRR